MGRVGGVDDVERVRCRVPAWMEWGTTMFEGFSEAEPSGDHGLDVLGCQATDNGRADARVDLEIERGARARSTTRWWA